MAKNQQPKKPSKQIKATPDSTKYFQKKLNAELAKTPHNPVWSAAANTISKSKGNTPAVKQAKYDLLRQKRKGLSGFDANGNPKKK